MMLRASRVPTSHQLTIGIGRYAVTVMTKLLELYKSWKTVGFEAACTAVTGLTCSQLSHYSGYSAAKDAPVKAVKAVQTNNDVPLLVFEDQSHVTLGGTGVDRTKCYGHVWTYGPFGRVQMAYNAEKTNIEQEKTTLEALDASGTYAAAGIKREDKAIRNVYRQLHYEAMMKPPSLALQDDGVTPSTLPSTFGTYKDAHPFLPKLTFPTSKVSDIQSSWTATLPTTTSAGRKYDRDTTLGYTSGKPLGFISVGGVPGIVIEARQESNKYNHAIMGSVSAALGGATQTGASEINHVCRCLHVMFAAFKTVAATSKWTVPPSVDRHKGTSGLPPPPKVFVPR